MNKASLTPDQYVAEIKKFTLKGDYKGGLKLARQAMAVHPDDLVCKFQYAKLLGDWADELPPAKQSRYKTEAVEVLRPLIRGLNGQSVETRFGVCLNFYYQQFAFQGMYQFGKRFEATDEKKGLYAQGIGACLYAEKLMHDGRTAPAVSWAKKAISAWNAYGLSKEKYYFPHYTLAKAYAISQQPKLALKALEKAAKLSSRTTADWEFADVMKMLKNQSN